MASSGDTTVIAGRRARAEKNDDYRNRRAVMLERAAFLFHTKGISETSLSDIAAAAGLDRATLYYYFPNKEQILAEVVRDAVTDSVAEIQRIATTDAPALDRLRQMVIKSTQLFDQHFPHLFVFMREDLQRSVSPEFLDWLREVTYASADVWRGVLADAMESGAMSSALPVDVVLPAVIGVVASVHRWYQPGADISPEAIGEGLAELILDGLRRRTR